MAHCGAPLAPLPGGTGSPERKSSKGTSTETSMVQQTFFGRGISISIDPGT